MEDEPRPRPDDREPSVEGVRIIGADEAEEVARRPDVASRRGEDEPRFGDRPARPEGGTRPALRFPLDDSADPSKIERPPVDPAPDPVTGPVELPHWTEPPTGEVPAVIAGDRGPLLDDDDEGDDDAWSSFATSTPRWRDADDDWDDGDYLADLAEHSGETHVGPLAHQDDDFDEFDDLDDLADERTAGRRRERSWSSADDLDWADDEPVWDDDPGSEVDEPTRGIEVGSIHDEAEDLGPGQDDPHLPPSRPETAVVIDDDVHDEPVVEDHAFDDDDHGFGDDDHGGLAAKFRPVEDGAGDGERDMAKAVGVGVGLAAVALIALIISPALMVVLVTAVLGLAALEWFSVLDNAEWESAGLLGVGVCIALPVAIYWRGPTYYPMLLFIIFAAVLAWFLVGAGGRDPRVLEGSMSTLFGIIWIGGFGSSAAGILALPEGRWLLLVAILATVAYDVGGLFIGRYLGQRPLSAASPNKTMEGLVGGMVLAFLITIVSVGIVSLGPWTGFSAVLLLGLGAACAAPLGDLTQSLLKRDLGIKDMGSILPGHGGLLDRFDSLLFVLPTVFWLTVVVGLS